MSNFVSCRPTVIISAGWGAHFWYSSVFAMFFGDAGALQSGIEGITRSQFSQSQEREVDEYRMIGLNATRFKNKE